MNQRWTLHVENFARIESADIEISPLMCFIGDNNSGKSYVMSLLWGIMSNEEFFLNEEKFEFESYITCREFIASHIDKEVTVTDNISQIFIRFFNDLLNECKENLVRKIFNHDIEIGRLEIKNLTHAKKLRLKFRYSENKTHLSFKRYQKTKLVPDGEDEIDDSKIEISITADDKYIDMALWKATVKIAFSILMMDWLTVAKNIKSANPIYLPASRTGFLMTYPQLASNLLKLAFSFSSESSKLQNKLTAPYIQFLQLLIELNDSIESERAEYKDLTEFISKEILHGTVKVTKNIKTVQYQADDMKKILPMSITSSVVTETAALLLLLTTKIPLRLVIIEEPEAHLHPALQKKMAQLLIRLVHSGISVWITTHSDTILQHFNNMIKLRNRSEKECEELLKEFEYTEEDLLTPEEINLYQFERGDKHTTIQKLQSGKYGFVVPSFNKAIDILMSEIFAFQEDD